MPLTLSHSKALIREGVDVVRPRRVALLKHASRALDNVVERAQIVIERRANEIVCTGIRRLQDQLECIVAEQEMRLPDLWHDPEVKYLTEDRLPTQMRALQEHLILREPAQAPHFLSFIPLVADMAEAGALEGESADEVAEAMIRALDDLDAYVLAHNLVSVGYRVAMHEPDEMNPPRAWLTVMDNPYRQAAYRAGSRSNATAWSQSSQAALELVAQ